MQQNIVPDSYQQAVIQSAAKDILVMAGAGSGKTFTLLSRIHRLVTYDNVDPECILVLTFTRVAAEHMRSKYMQVQDSRYDAVPDFNTFHAFCYRVLSEYPGVAKALGYSSVPSIATDVDMQRYKMQAKDESACRLSDRQLSKPYTLSGKSKRMYENYCKAYNRILKRANVIDYDSLNELVCKLFTDDSECIAPVKEKYKYVFVDEFQDTDKYEYEFVKSMQHCKRVLCGDALQNIYQFRGCSNKPMKQLIDSDAWVVYKLPVNYRSSYKICDYVNSLSAKFHSKKYRVELKSGIPGMPVREWSSNSGDKEYDLARYVSACVKNGSVAVLCRTNREVEHFTNSLSKQGVQCSRQLDTEYSVNLIKACTDDSTLYRWLAANLSDKEYSLYRKLKLQGVTDKKVFTDKVMYFPSTSTILEDVDSIKQVLSLYSLNQCSFVLCSMFDVPLPEVEFEAKEELLAYIDNKVHTQPDSTVHVGTIHSVKGLEYDSVAVMNVNGNSFKIKSEEQENLLYTACTRAKKNLILFYDCTL